MNSELLRKRMSFLKNLLQIEDYSHKKVKHLSGGSKRKLCCGITLLIPPQILFLDEISNGVDPMSRNDLYTYLRTLKNTACFLITHRIDEAEKLCDRIGFMIDG